MIARLAAAALLVLAALPAVATPPERIRIGSTSYVFRGVFGAGIAEYTPEDQADLDRFRDMLMALPVPDGVRTAEHLPEHLDELERQAMRHGGQVLMRQCDAATRMLPAACGLYVAYVRPGHTEMAITRLLATPDGVIAIAYARREYGEGAPARTEAWIRSAEGQRRIAEFIDTIDALAAPAPEPAAAPALNALDFGGEALAFAWSNGTQFEYVPAGETPQGRWTRMVTLQHVPGVHDEEGLRAYTALLRRNLQAHGTVTLDECAPGADGRPECVLVALLAQGDVAEWVVSRTVLDGRRAVNASIGRRTYGPDARARLAELATGADGREHFLRAMRWPIPDGVPDARPAGTR